MRGRKLGTWVQFHRHSRREGDKLPAAGRGSFVTAAAWAVCVALALIEVWSGQRYTDPDGISYLDMSDAFLRRNIHLLINPLWSPLYPLLIGAVRWLIRPSAYWEFPAVHGVNFIIFLGALAAFDFLLRQVIRTQGQEQEVDTGPARPLPPWMWQLFGYSLFMWGTFVMINGLRKVVPDLCVATFVYVDAGLVLQIRRGARKPLTFVLLGLALGLGYLAKAIMFPLAFVFMGTAFFAAGGTRKVVMPLALTLVVFMALAAPLILGISREVGRPSFGESGRLNYAWHVNGKDPLTFYTSSPPPYLLHPLNLIHRNPNVFEFGEPFRVTYPPYFDPPYWNAGLQTHMNLREQLRVIGESATVYYSALVAPVWALIGGVITLLFMSPNLPGRLRNVAASWPLLAPCAVALCVYALVHVEPRYVAPFVVMFWLALLSGVRLKNSQDSSRLGAVVTLVVAGSLSVLTAQYVYFHLAERLPILQGHGGTYYRVAASLNEEGVPPGATVAIIGSGWDSMFWARLARVRIVAQIPADSAEDFWRSDSSTQQRVLENLTKLGIKAVVTDEKPRSSGALEWLNLAAADRYACLLPLPPTTRAVPPPLASGNARRF